METWGRTGLFSANKIWVHGNLLVDLDSGDVWWPEELESNGLQMQEAWRELRWRQAGRNLNESGERPIWNAGSEKLLPVVWDFSSGRGVWLVIFPSLPSFPSTNTVRPWGTGVSQAWSPPFMGLLPPQGRKTSRDSPLDGFGILIVGALWRKSWKANWMWRLEAVREPGPGDGGASRRWPLIPNERKRPLLIVGQKVLVESEFLCGTHSFYHQLRAGKERVWKGIFQLC